MESSCSLFPLPIILYILNVLNSFLKHTSVQSQTGRARVCVRGPALQVLHARSRGLKLSTTETQKPEAAGAEGREIHCLA